MISTKDPNQFNFLIIKLSKLVSQLKQTHSILEKISLLDSLPDVHKHFKQLNFPGSITRHLNAEFEYVIKSIIVIDQSPILFNKNDLKDGCEESLLQLLEHLLEIEYFYQDLGGIIGYHLTVSELLAHPNHSVSSENITYLTPETVHLNEDTLEIRRAVKWGLQSLPKVAEIYPVGGSGDRLNLKDPTSGIALPAALLAFNGRSLLEELIRDVQAREYLFFKLYGKQLITPIGMMTSSEKDNHNHILDICHKKHWFGRPQDLFFFFIQPLAPVITIDGNWSLYEPLKMTLKPGGHGVIWKLAQEKGLFSWLLAKGYDRSIIRQINNPLAGVDHSILALIGLGCHKDKAIGFISCERLINSAEGTNVLIEKETQNGFEYCLTNIEYTDFEKKNIVEPSSSPQNGYSSFPTNTNILFVSIPSIIEALNICSIPGRLINMKTKVTYRDSEGNISIIEGGRLESTMQNIADYFVDVFPIKQEPEHLKYSLKNFITYNQRSKTISAMKPSELLFMYSLTTSTPMLVSAS